MINWWMVLGASVLQIVLGSIWYGPLFGKLWMRLMGVSHLSREEIKAKQKQALPLYIIQLVTSIITNAVLYLFVIQSASGMWLVLTVILWLGFVLPIQAGEVIWSTLSSKMKMKKLAVSASYQLLSMLIAAYIYVTV